jgi:hypothetical protein
MDPAHRQPLACALATLPFRPAGRLGHFLPLQGSDPVTCRCSGPRQGRLPADCCPVLPG